MNKPIPSRANEAGSGVAQFGPVGGAGGVGHLGETGGHGMGGVTGGGQMMGAGHLAITTGGHCGAVGRLHRMVGMVGMLSTGTHLMGVGGVKILTGAQRTLLLRAASPRLSFTQVSAERIAVAIRKERINFIVMFSVGCSLRPRFCLRSVLHDSRLRGKTLCAYCAGRFREFGDALVAGDG